MGTATPPWAAGFVAHAAIVWIVIGCAVWSLLTGTLSRTVVRRTT